MVKLRSGTGYTSAYKGKGAVLPPPPDKEILTFVDLDAIELGFRPQWVQDKAAAAKKRKARVASAPVKVKVFDAATSDNSDSDCEADEESETSATPTKKRKLGTDGDNLTNVSTQPAHKRAKLSKKQLATLLFDDDEDDIAASNPPPAVAPTHEPLESANNSHEDSTATNNANMFNDTSPTSPEPDTENNSVDHVTESHEQTAASDIAEVSGVATDASNPSINTNTDDDVTCNMTEPSELTTEAMTTEETVENIVDASTTSSEADSDDDSVDLVTESPEQTATTDDSGIATGASTSSPNTNTDDGITGNATDTQEPTTTPTNKEEHKRHAPDDLKSPSPKRLRRRFCIDDDSDQEDSDREEPHKRHASEDELDSPHPKRRFIETDTEEDVAEETTTGESRKRHASDDDLNSSSPKRARPEEQRKRHALDDLDSPSPKRSRIDEGLGHGGSDEDSSNHDGSGHGDSDHGNSDHKGSEEAVGGETATEKTAGVNEGKRHGSNDLDTPSSKRPHIDIEFDSDGSNAEWYTPSSPPYSDTGADDGPFGMFGGWMTVNSLRHAEDPNDIADGKFPPFSPLQSHAEDDDGADNLMDGPTVLSEDEDAHSVKAGEDADSAQLTVEHKNVEGNQQSAKAGKGPEPKQDEIDEDKHEEDEAWKLMFAAMNPEGHHARGVKPEDLPEDEREIEDAWTNMFSALGHLKNEEKKLKLEEEARKFEERLQRGQEYEQEEIELAKEKRRRERAEERAALRQIDPQLRKRVERINKTVLKNGFPHNRSVGRGWAFQVARDAGVDMPDEYPAYDPFASDKENDVNWSRKKMKKIRAMIAEEMKMDPKDVQLPVDKESIDLIALEARSVARNARARRRRKLMKDLKDSARKGIGRITVEEALELDATSREAWFRADTITLKKLQRLNQAFSDVLIHILREKQGWTRGIPWEARVATIAIEEWTNTKPCFSEHNQFKGHPGIVSHRYKRGSTLIVYDAIPPETLFHALVATAKKAWLRGSRFRDIISDYTKKAWGGQGQEVPHEIPEGVIEFVENYARIVVNWALRKEGKLREGLPEESWEQSRAGETVSLTVSFPFDGMTFLH
ncbi:uncharacterized protein K452DRAFT_91876 [Aplosporella prunicola CBS 121167]|uniref:Uncharacterized protein n=1 Tax=Aplosporella prunicola CBS 121167 TaxID=1176127 RepID=A0A6A6B286_9PEZI|nr:uncharacterized protein K452DRAFT_91876 [Aplosporella prunicola CBS 121167]KAF2138322.1 hypothetical protein K452DRAFT_91876 [Aplosporella prunicola CBS 121167]